MVIDTFMYNGEEDILDIRLNTLNQIVDKFIILESPTSHSRLSRELEYPKQASRFKKFEDKINYHAIDYCTNENFLLNDWIGRAVIEEILIKQININNEDIIIHGDLDEIPKPESLIRLIQDNNHQKPSTLMMDSRQLCLDLELVENRNGRIRGNFPGSMILNLKHLIKYKLYWLRQIRCNVIINDVDYKDTFNLIDNSGWHFSYCAGINKTIDKFKFFCHANEMDGSTKDREGLINCIRNKISFSPSKNRLVKVDFNQENIPDYVLNNTNLFKEILSFNY